MLLVRSSLRKWQGSQEPCARTWGQRPAYTCSLISQEPLGCLSLLFPGIIFQNNCLHADLGLRLCFPGETQAEMPTGEGPREFQECQQRESQGDHQAPDPCLIRISGSQSLKLQFQTSPAEGSGSLALDGHLHGLTVARLPGLENHIGFLVLRIKETYLAESILVQLVRCQFIWGSGEEEAHKYCLLFFFF